MKRVPIGLENDLYETLRERASREKKSIAEVVCEIIKRNISPSGGRRSSSAQNFAFISVCRSKQVPLKPLSERHDDAL